MNFDGSPSGRVVRTATGYKTFIPNSLLPLFNWGHAHVNSLSRADFLLGNLAREAAKLPNPHLFIRPFLPREAVLSSRIEGTQASVSDVLAADTGVYIGKDRDDLQEVRNYIHALDFGVSRLKDLPLSLSISYFVRLSRTAFNSPKPTEKRLTSLSTNSLFEL